VTYKQKLKAKVYGKAVFDGSLSLVFFAKEQFSSLENITLS
jgi:hypothetical protein